MTSRQSWFAVWRWPAWVQCGCLCFAALGAFLTPPIARQLYARTGYNQAVNRLLCRLEQPLLHVHGLCPAVSEIYQFESATIDRIFGPPPMDIFWHEGRASITIIYEFPDAQHPTAVPIFAGPISSLPPSLHSVVTPASE